MQSSRPNWCAVMSMPMQRKENPPRFGIWRPEYYQLKRDMPGGQTVFINEYMCWQIWNVWTVSTRRMSISGPGGCRRGGRQDIWLWNWLLDAVLEASPGSQKCPDAGSSQPGGDDLPVCWRLPFVVGMRDRENRHCEEILHSRPWAEAPGYTWDAISSDRIVRRT